MISDDPCKGPEAGASPVWQGSKPREANAADAHPDDPYLAGTPVPIMSLLEGSLG